jgi:L-lactate dehydrogenase
LRVAPDAVFIVATNPVDVMTHLSARIAGENGIDLRRVLGSGTTLDTARFRSLLSAHCGVNPHHVHGYVIGEHGDSEVLTWSLATIGGLPLEAFAELRGITRDESVRVEIDRKVRGAAYTIISGKGATFYGIGSALARITESILNDQRSILTVCAPASEISGVRDVTISLPRLIGGGGVQETFPLPLDDFEHRQLQSSAQVIRQAIDELDMA